MKNANLVLLGLLFVSSILLAGITVGVTNMIIEAGNSNILNARDIDATPPALTISESETLESMEITSHEPEEASFISEEMEMEDNLPVTNFTSFEELRSFLSDNTYNRTYPYLSPSDWQSPSTTISFSYGVSVEDLVVNDKSDSDGTNDHSTTNVQVQGVDEGDFIKNDGEYAYIVTNNQRSIVIVKIYETKDARIESKIDLNAIVSEIYIHDNLLIALGSKSYDGLFVYIFDTTVKDKPTLAGKIFHKASITDSRMIGDYLYLVASRYIDPQITEEELGVPVDQIYYFCNFNYTKNYYSQPLVSIIAINVKDPYNSVTVRNILMGRSQTIYVSSKNIYVTHTKWERTYNYYSSSQKTQIHGISIVNGTITYKAKGEVLGTVLNRYSMDEYDGHFRLAVTIGWQTSHSVYVLDMNLTEVGKVDDIAPTERLYSARFMGPRAYLVTFKKVDPFFVIDLSDPKSPSILGELKIPGYSDYLHPYDENHVIGLGKDTYDMGSFAWYQGVKLSLFNVTDVNNPTEEAKFIIGDRGTYSPAQHDPHAFLFDRNRNLLVIPITLYEINETKYPNASPSQQGEFTWQGAYVFDLSQGDGFELKGRITHKNENSQPYGYWYKYSSGDTIQRSFYIEDVLYTYSNYKLKMNCMHDLFELHCIDLPDSSDYEEIYICTPISISSP